MGETISELKPEWDDAIDLPKLLDDIGQSRDRLVSGAKETDFNLKGELGRAMAKMSLRGAEALVK